MRRLALAAAAVVALVSSPGAQAGGVPVEVALAGRTIWTTSDSGLRVIDRATGKLLARPLSSRPYAVELAVGDGSVWVGTIENGYIAGSVDRFDLAGRHRRTPLRFPARAVYEIAFGGHALWAWIGSPDDARNSFLVRAGSTRRIHLAGRPGWLAAGSRGAWLADGLILRFVSRSGGVRREPLRRTGPLVAAFGSVWVAHWATVVRIDETTHRQLATIPLAGAPYRFAVGPDRLWVATDGRHPHLAAIDPTRGRVVAMCTLSDLPSGIAADRRHVWLGESGFNPRVVRLNATTLRKEKTIPLDT
jgi:ligand-binding sensor domain-containing protein